jgi:hypothetical protein
MRADISTQKKDYVEGRTHIATLRGPQVARYRRFSTDDPRNVEKCASLAETYVPFVELFPKLVAKSLFNVALHPHTVEMYEGYVEESLDISTQDGRRGARSAILEG